MINPAKLLQFKKEWGGFASRHPRFVQFAQAVIQGGVTSGSVVEITVTTAEGKTLNSNMRLSEEDLELIRNLKDAL